MLGQRVEKSDSIYKVPLPSTVASQIQFPSVAFCIFYPLTDLHKFKYNTKLQTPSKEAREETVGEACLSFFMLMEDATLRVWRRGIARQELCQTLTWKSTARRDRQEAWEASAVGSKHLRCSEQGCWGRAFSNLNPCQHHLREQDVSSKLATRHLSRERKNPLDNAKVSWEYPAGERGHSPGGLCTDTGM